MRTVPMLALASCSMLFSGCFGSSDPAYAWPGNAPQPPGQSSPPPPPPPPVERGTLEVHVTDEDDRPLRGFYVTVGNGMYRETDPVITDDSGRASLRVPLGPALITVRGHAHGSFHQETREIFQTDTTALRLRVLPDHRHTVALLPATVTRAGPSELRVHLTVLAAKPRGFMQHSYGGIVPFLQWGDCWVSVDPATRNTGCEYGNPQIHGVAAYSHDPKGAPASAATDPVVLLLVDQGLRASLADPHGHRWRAARFFASQFREGSRGGLLAAAGFSGAASSESPHAPLQLPPAALDGTQVATLFTADAAEQLDMLDANHYPGGEPSDTVAAVRNAIDLLGQHAPAGTRSLVVLTGPLEPEIDDATFASLASLRRESGVQVLLVSVGLPEGSEDRLPLAKLAAALQAPVIVAGYPTSWDAGANPESENGIIRAMGLAASYLTGESLPSIKASLILRHLTGSEFTPGTPIHQRAWVETDICPMGCALVPLDLFAIAP